MMSLQWKKGLYHLRHQVKISSRPCSIFELPAKVHFPPGPPVCLIPPPRQPSCHNSSSSIHLCADATGRFTCPSHHISNGLTSVLHNVKALTCQSFYKTRLEIPPSGPPDPQPCAWIFSRAGLGQGLDSAVETLLSLVHKSRKTNCGRATFV